MSILALISSLVGSRPYSCTSRRTTLTSLLIDSITCTGSLMTLECSARARVTPWRTHHVAYVLSLYPRRKSNLSTALISPIFPSWIRSGRLNPRPAYRFATLTTNLKFASAIICLALLPSFLMYLKCCLQVSVYLCSPVVAAGRPRYRWSWRASRCPMPSRTTSGGTSRRQTESEIASAVVSSGSHSSSPARRFIRSSDNSPSIASRTLPSLTSTDMVDGCAPSSRPSASASFAVLCSRPNTSWRVSSASGGLPNLASRPASRSLRLLQVSMRLPRSPSSTRSRRLTLLMSCR